MNFDKIASLAITVVVMAAIAGNLDRLNYWVLKIKAPTKRILKTGGNYMEAIQL
jgi:hypothetical protein